MKKVSDQIKDGQVPDLPKDVVFCKRCVTSNQRPRIIFNEDGVCSACEFAEIKDSQIDWDAREQELNVLLDQHRSSTGEYDVIVPASGGKDSAFVAHQLKHKYGMHPLTITWAPFVFTDIGWQNYVAFKDAGFDNILGFPDGQFHRKLSLLGFDLLGDAWEPFAYGQKSWAFHLSVKFGIPLIFYGENGEAEYGGTTRSRHKAFESPDEWSDIYYKGTGIDYLIEEGLLRGIFEPGEVSPATVNLYKAPSRDALAHVGSRCYWMSYFRKWVPQEHYYYAAEHTGFKANPVRSEGTYSKYASLDDKMDGFHWYLSYIKFGMGRATRDSSME